MDTPNNRFGTIDEYLGSLAPASREKLQTLREAVREVAPEAEEAIRYQIPTFLLDGNLVHFAAYKSHIGMYPVPAASGKVEQELSRYQTGKGTLRFPLDEPLPLPLIRTVVELRIKENQEQRASKARRARRAKPG